jgi:AraC family transcriptional regulator, regulatory protein of adaptative response / DNA-3-methyladenine glycosylase II
MALDHDECYRALCARDPRLDGRFFICVHTTGIFCRPICPARTPKRENVQFVATAEAAVQLGFRPCKRCRPEVKAGSAAWDLTGASLRRALRMIDGGALDEQSVDDFAARLGMGARHLRRIIKSNLGVAPNRLALVRRAAFARSLIESGSLSMTEIAAASGFGSLRRFNDVMRKEFGTNPMSLRTRTKSLPMAGEMTLSLRGKGVVSWPSMQAFYAARAVAGIEHVEGQTYRRTMVTDDGAVLMAISQSTPETIDVVLGGAKVADLFGLATRIRRALDLDTDVAVVAGALRADDVLRPILQMFNQGLRLPRAWDPFELAVRALLGQQISVKAARTLASRMVARFGQPMTAAHGVPGLTHVFPRPQALARADVADFVALGLTKARAGSLLGLAKAAHEDPELFSPARSLDALIERLCALEGVGAWTAHYIALRAFGEADAFPASDLGLRKAYGALSGTMPSAAELERIATKWSPWRGYAAQYLWTHLSTLEDKETTDELAA